MPHLHIMSQFSVIYIWIFSVRSNYGNFFVRSLTVLRIIMVTISTRFTSLKFLEIFQDFNHFENSVIKL